MQARQAIRLADIPALSFAVASLVGVVGSLFIPLSEDTGFAIALILAAVALLCLAFPQVGKLSGLIGYAAIATLVLARGESHIARPDRAWLAQINSDTVIANCRGVVVWREGGRETARSEKFRLGNVRLEIGDSVLESSSLQVRLSLPLSDATVVDIGDVVACKARIIPLHHRQGCSARELTWSLQKRLWADAKVTDRATLIVIKGSRGTSYYVERTRAAILSVFARSLSSDGSAVAGALLLGARETFAPGFRLNLQATGLAHLFALSGLNTGLLVSLCWLVLATLQVPRNARYAVLILLLVAYTLLGLGVPSLFRSALMALLFIVGRLLTRASHPANLLLFAFAIELFLWPLHVLDAGFILSYLSMAGILAAYVGLSRPVQELLDARTMNVSRRFSEILTGTLGAQLSTAPVVALLFGRAPALAVFANIVAIPLFSLLLVLILLMLAASTIADVAVYPLAQVIDLIVKGFAVGTSAVASLPIASIVADNSWGILTIGLLAQAFGIAQLWRGRVRNGVVLSLICLNVIVWGGILNQHTKGEVARIGNGERAPCFVRLGESCGLIGFGTAWDAERTAYAVHELLLQNGYKSLDFAVVLNRSTEHIGGAPEVLSLLRPAIVFDYSHERPTNASYLYDAVMKLHDIRVVVPDIGEKYALDSTTFVTLMRSYKDTSESTAFVFALADNVVLGYTHDIPSDVVELREWAVKRSHMLEIDLSGGEIGSRGLCDSAFNRKSTRRCDYWILTECGWKCEESLGEKLVRLWSIPEPNNAQT